jgi:hypothetical protein
VGIFPIAVHYSRRDKVLTGRNAAGARLAEARVNEVDTRTALGFSSLVLRFAREGGMKLWMGAWRPEDGG